MLLPSLRLLLLLLLLPPPPSVASSSSRAAAGAEELIASDESAMASEFLGSIHVLMPLKSHLGVLQVGASWTARMCKLHTNTAGGVPVGARCVNNVMYTQSSAR